MAGITSLLRSAQATRKKIQAQQDAEVAFQWENSAQTYDDFLQYSNYLEQAANKTNDPSDRLSYAVKTRSAQRSYTSNELQRQQMSIMEGNATTTDKMESVKGLYEQAVANGDFNLAQNLISQWDGLSIKLQNEQEAAAKAYVAAGTTNNKVFDNLVSDLQKGVDDITLPTGQVVTPLAVLDKALQETGDSSAVWKAAEETLAAIQSVIVDQYQAATTQEQVDTLEQKYGKGLQDLTSELTFKVGGKTLSYQDVVNSAANDSLNNPIYSLQATHNDVTGKNEFKLKENNVSSLDYIRQVGPNGEDTYVPIQTRTDQNSLNFGMSDQGRGLDTQITDTGSVIGDNIGKNGQQIGDVNAGSAQVNRDQSQTIGNRLKNLGIIAKTNGTTLSIKLPNESVERNATIQPDGSIRYFGDDGQILEIGLVDRNLGTDSSPQIFRAGEARAVAPDEISDFGSKSAFGGTLSQSSTRGDKYVTDILGKSPTDKIVGNLTGPIRVGNDFSGDGTAVTSNLLQSAGAQRQAIQVEQQRQAMLQAQAEAAAQLQASQTFNLNQTPIQQLASTGVLKNQLQVATPIAAPRVTVAAPAPTPKITSVGVAPAQPRVVVQSPYIQTSNKLSF